MEQDRKFPNSTSTTDPSSVEAEELSSSRKPKRRFVGQKGAISAATAQDAVHSNEVAQGMVYRDNRSENLD